MITHFQLWRWNSKLYRKCKWLAKLWQWGCGLFGHEVKHGDWGYGGGNTADVWCSRCNKLIQIPKSELQFRIDKDNRELLNMVGKKI